MRFDPFEPPLRERADSTDIGASHDQVDVWSVRLTRSDQELTILEQTLSFNERARADRFRFERDRSRFIAARANLRMILSRYIGIDPRSLAFSYGPHGKPALAQPIEAGALKFNLSHSGELALVAVTQDRDVGVDLEEMRFIEDADKIAEQFFSPRENETLRALSGAEKLEAFFHCWTRKEAYLKATGDGLARPTRSFDVTLAPDEPARLVNVEGQSLEASRWSLVGLVPARGYVGAVAVQGHRWTAELRAVDSTRVARLRRKKTTK
jgi:4'-phosphopantetheinyl transferase